MYNKNEWMKQAGIIADIIQKAPKIDKMVRVSTAEFKRRHQAVINAVKDAVLDCAVVYSDEHYNGDVPYLGGNTNISIEPVAGVIGPGGFHILAGLEGGYIAEQLVSRSTAVVHKVEMLKLADEEYPVDAENADDVFVLAAGGKKPSKIGLLTPCEVFPVSMYNYLEELVGKDNIVNAQELYYKIKYEKSDEEMALIEQASLIADVMIEGMLAVLKPGMTETQVAQWGYAIAYELGCEEMGFDIMVTAGQSNRTLIGKALNNVINEGDVVHIGVAPKRDGLNACERVSVVCTGNPNSITDDQKFWFDFVEQAFKVGLNAYIDVAKNNKPAKLQEQALVDYFKSREAEVNKRFNINIDLPAQKPYTGTHNSGYTECQEFYGAITLNSDSHLGTKIVTMLDVAVRGMGNMWNDVVIPGLDYILVEKTLGKNGSEVRVLNNLPVNVQHLVGAGYK